MPTPNPIKQSPVTVLQGAAAAGGALLAALVAHGVIPVEVAKTFGPYFVLLYVAVFAAWTWRHTTPWTKARGAVEDLEHGRLPDADLGRVDALVRDALADFLELDADTHVGVVTGSTHRDGQLVGAPAPSERLDGSFDGEQPPGMGAGA